jgi:hypothetical protein
MSAIWGILEGSSFLIMLAVMLVFSFVASQIIVRRSAVNRRDAEASFFSAIEVNDPAFTWDGFSTRAEAAYQVVQRARLTGDPSSAKDWLTEQMLRFLDQEATQDRDRTAKTPLVARHIGVLRVRREADTFLLDARITALATRDVFDALMGPAPQSILGVTVETQPLLDETWTFVRPVSARTPGPGLERPANCPNCGAPIESTGAAKCPYCGESLYDGAGDWLVGAIAPTDPVRGVSSQLPSPIGVA